MKKIVAIVAGEPNSINSEIIAKVLRLKKKNNKIIFFVIGNFLLLKSQLKQINIKIRLNKINNLSEINENIDMNILDIPLIQSSIFSVDNKFTSKYVLLCLDKANHLALNNKIVGFINCAIDKRKTFNNRFLGVTEYLSKKNKLNKSEVMMIYNKELSVVPITTHIKVRNISKNISKKIIIKKLNTLNNYYFKILKKKPIIAVLGLNPHNDENRKNSEERKFIIPAIKASKKKLKIIGPFPADTIFSTQKKYNYDVIVGMYHDQVLAPFKAKYGYDAINITLGLKYIRISPDHGTASDIIGLNKADPTSLLNCLNFFKDNVR
ncbi:4-hydroxythreonine-4-phosphate dehydrogenase PdxA [Pelagibacteraceae bacterium]|nr:4-hydroxythreonine-4-phosphate dehydrogenase PdxA [Pelagibacteraceae bacterium]